MNGKIMKATTDMSGWLTKDRGLKRVTHKEDRTEMRLTSKSNLGTDRRFTWPFESQSSANKNLYADLDALTMP